MAIATGLAVAGASLAGAAISANAAGDAADQQAASADAGIAEQRRQFESIRDLLSPYVDAGSESLSAQMGLIGLNGERAQERAINGLENSPQMQALTQQGENAILQNASATGGLRGGNTQAALAQFRPQLLSQMINQQYSNLGGLTSIGQNAAAGTGNAGMQTGTNITSLLETKGAAQAGATIAQGNAINQGVGALTNFMMNPQGF